MLQCIAALLGLIESQENSGIVSDSVLETKLRGVLEKQRILVLVDNFEYVPKKHQQEILNFFYSLHGESQLLLSTRRHPHEIFRQEPGRVTRKAYVAVRVKGLLDKAARTLVRHYMQANYLDQDEYKLSDDDVSQILSTTYNNPKVILTLLGLIKPAHSVSKLIAAIKSRRPDADNIYDCVIGEAWEHFLTQDAQNVLIAKALFAHSVLESDLAMVVGISDDAFTGVLKSLTAISFFEYDQQHRIQTHPLAQEFAYQMLANRPELRDAIERRWWERYCARMLKKLGAISESLDDDIGNIYAHVFYTVSHQTPFLDTALDVFAKPSGLENALRHRGRWKEMMILAEKVLDIAIQREDARLVGLCALRFIGRVYRVRGDLETAENKLAFVEDYNALWQDKWLRALIVAVQGAIYRQRRYSKAAQKCYQKGLKLFKGQGDSYYIAKLYSALGGTAIQELTKELGSPVDSSEATNAKLSRIQGDLEKSTEYWHKQGDTQEEMDWNSKMELLKIQVWKGIIYRIQGQFDEARTLFHGCLNQLGLLNNARIYRELALLEYLANTQAGKQGCQRYCLPRMYEIIALSIFEKLGVPEHLVNYQCHTSSCFINNLKKSGEFPDVDFGKNTY